MDASGAGTSTRWSGATSWSTAPSKPSGSRGSNVSMDEIAAEIGVSKTVLYRYFVDKNDLTTAVMMRFAQTTLIPNMACGAVRRTSTASPSPARSSRCTWKRLPPSRRPYPVRDGEQLGEQAPRPSPIPRQIIARMLAVMLRRRMQARPAMDTPGVEPWAFIPSAASSWPPTRGCRIRG